VLKLAAETDSNNPASLSKQSRSKNGKKRNFGDYFASSTGFWN